MEPYQQMYYKLFNKMTELVSEIQEVQRVTEEMFIMHEDRKIEEVSEKADGE